MPHAWRAIESKVSFCVATSGVASFADKATATCASKRAGPAHPRPVIPSIPNVQLILNSTTAVIYARPA